MSEETGSDRAYMIWREAAEKYDYFMTGLAAALAGYIAPTLQPARINWSPGFLELTSILAFAFSVFAGSRRILTMANIVKIGGERLRLTEKLAVFSAARAAGSSVLDQATGTVLTHDAVPQIESLNREYVAKYKELEEIRATAASRWANARDWSLIAGFLILTAARVWKGYA